MVKKKAAGKAAKEESEEERAARLEMEGLAEEEKARTRAELARVALRQRQLREQEYARVNGVKLQNQWRRIMRAAKVDELRRQVEVLSQAHEREVDRKDALVQLLDTDLEEAEEQHQTALRAHLVVIDRLLDLQAARLAGMEARFNADLQDLQDEFASERGEIAASHSRQKKELQEMTEAMKVEFANSEAEARQEFESAREEVRNRDSEEYNVLKIQLEGIIEDLERHFEQAHKAYIEGTAHRSASFRALTKGDADASAVIEQRMKKLLKLQEDLQHWRLKISTNRREWEERNAALQREKQQMARHYSQLRAALDASRAAAAERLRQLSLSSGGAIQELRGKLAKAEAVLKLAEMCRKLETEQEKVMPFWSIPSAAASAAAAAAAAEGETEQGAAGEASDGGGGDSLGSGSRRRPSLPLQPSGGPGGGQGALFGDAAERQRQPWEQQDGPRLSAVGLDDIGREVDEWNSLDRFFCRYNKAVLDVAAVGRERGRLEQENAQLRGLLKGFLDGISVNEAVLSAPTNPLLVVNQRLQRAMAEQQKQRSASSPARQQQQAPAGAPQQQQRKRPPRELCVSGVAAVGAVQ